MTNIIDITAAQRRSLLATAVSLLLLGNAQAAPGTLAQSPLFLSSSVQSNIFFAVDDSGSMNWEVLLTRGADIAHPNDAVNIGGLDYTPDDAVEQRRLCAGYNAMAYNPNRTYTPWVGKDSAGVTYGNASVSAARTNPYDASSTTTDLRNHYYFLWNDANNDGVYQNGECPTHSDNAANTTSECAGFGASVCQIVNGRTSSPTQTALTAAQQTNYANWYSYYRKREYGAKRALSAVISGSSARMGMTTLHNNNSVRTPIRDVDDITTPINTTAQSNKNTLLNNLFRIDSSGLTPLRSTLNDTGTYFESGKTSWGSEWTSPILSAAQGGACQQNFTIVMSDGYWNSDTSFSIGNTDIDGPGEWDGGSYADNWSHTLADVAMHYYERDLKPDLENLVRKTAADQNAAQHLVTFTVAFGINGSISANPTSVSAPFTWPNPTDTEDADRVDDMRHAAWNGRGQFLSASDPDQLATELGRAIAEIDARSGSAAAVSFNSTSLQSDTLIFQAQFDSGRWSGDLNAIPIDADGEISAATWTATKGDSADSNGLDERAHTLRTFYSYNGTAGITLDWANLTTAQKDDLRKEPNGTVSSDAKAKARLGYFKGDRGCEIGNTTDTCNYDSGAYTTKAFRNRGSRLGDIVHSSPLFIGAPNTPYPDSIESAKYSTFVNSSAKDRRQVVYVGSNDGMLHAFDVENKGRELFSYVPNLLFSTNTAGGLHYLSDTTYLHKWYVDLSPSSADVYINSAWKTVLVGGLRGGGKGLFALDVTDPANFSASKVLWEFTHAQLGNTFSEIRIGKLNNGKWAAIFGNGYNNDPSGDGKAKLFIVYLDGSNLSAPIILDTGVGSVTSSDCGNSSSDCNGLSSPALADIDGDGIIDRAYAGDLHGNVWAFDLSSSSTTSWAPAYGSTPLFKACTSATCTAGNRQPITGRMALARHKTQRSVGTAPNLMVFFGTGQYIAVNDSDNALQQSYYGVWDAGAGGLNRSDLQAQTIGTDTVGGLTVRTLSDTSVNYASKKGWYMDFPTEKERVVTGSTAIGDVVFFSTMIPSTSICGYGGSGWLMLATQLDGGAPTFGAVDVNGDGVIDNADKTATGKFAAGVMSDGIPTESRFISDKRVTTDSSGAIIVDTVEPFERNQPGRTSWTPIEY